MPKRSSKLPSDANKRAKSIVDQATGEKPRKAGTKKNAAAVELGRRGGLKGGKARAESLTADERAAIARKAAMSRWKSDS